MTETGAPPREAEKEVLPSSSAPRGVEEDDDKRPAKRQARGEGDVVDDVRIKPSTIPSIVPAATRLAAVYSVHRPDSSIFKRGGMKREAPAELAATNEKAKRKQRKQEEEAAVAADAKAAAAASAAAVAASAAAAAAATATEGKKEEEDDAATLRRRLSELRDAWAAPRRGRGLSGAAWVASSAAAVKQEEEEVEEGQTAASAKKKKKKLLAPPPPPRVARVAPARSKLAPRMGFHHRGLQYLHPEEAAFLVDRGDLVLAVGVVAAAKKEEETEEEEEENKGGGGDEPAAAATTTTAAAAAKPSKPSYPPPPPAALEGDARSARALSVQEALSLSVGANCLFVFDDVRKTRKKSSQKKKLKTFQRSSLRACPRARISSTRT